MHHHVFSYEAGERLEPFYTGGDVILSSDARLLYTSCDSSVKAVNVETGQTTLSVSEVLTPHDLTCVCVCVRYPSYDLT